MGRARRNQYLKEITKFNLPKGRIGDIDKWLANVYEINKKTIANDKFKEFHKQINKQTGKRTSRKDLFIAKAKQQMEWNKYYDKKATIKDAVKSMAGGKLYTSEFNHYVNNFLHGLWKNPLASQVFYKINGNSYDITSYQIVDKNTVVYNGKVKVTFSHSGKNSAMEMIVEYA